jgi:hypothetical protein
VASDARALVRDKDNSVVTESVGVRKIARSRATRPVGPPCVAGTYSIGSASSGLNRSAERLRLKLGDLPLLGDREAVG